MPQDAFLTDVNRSLEKLGDYHARRNEAGKIELYDGSGATVAVFTQAIAADDLLACAGALGAVYHQGVVEGAREKMKEISEELDTAAEEALQDIED